MKVLNGTRFGMFAVAHILWSVVCSPFVPRLLDGEVVTACVVAAGMMLVYLLLGWLTARVYRWPVPTKKQSLWAVFLPADFAWLWAGTTAVCLTLPGDAIAVSVVLGLSSFLLASPSLLFVISFMRFMERFCDTIGFYDRSPLLGVAIFFAGILPPLLFWLGSRLGADQQETKEPETA